METWNSLAAPTTMAAASFETLNAASSPASLPNPQLHVDRGVDPFSRIERPDSTAWRPPASPQEGFQINLGNNAKGPVDMSGNGRTSFNVGNLHISENGPFDAHFGNGTQVYANGNHTTVSGNGTYDVHVGNNDYRGKGPYNFTFTQLTPLGVAPVAPRELSAPDMDFLLRSSRVG